MSLYVFVLTGNIGAGKSTALHFLETLADGESFELEVVPENVRAWQFNLARMYRDGRYKCMLQFDVLSHFIEVTRLLDKKEELCSRDGIPRAVVVERSPFDVRDVFLADGDEDGMTSRERFVLREAFDLLCSRSVWRDSRFAMVVSNPTGCAERIRQRGRTGEEHISDNALSNIEDAYLRAFFVVRARNEGRLETLHNQKDIGAFMSNLRVFYRRIKAALTP